MHKTGNTARTLTPYLVAGILFAILLIPPVAAKGHAFALNFRFDGIGDVSPAHLEGWAIFGDEKVSTGKFQVDSDGVLRTLEGEEKDTFVVDRDLSEADLIVVTIEPEGDTDDIPSGIVVLAGALSGDSAKLSFPVDFSDIQGSYILATPTNGAETDELSGIWFLELPLPPEPSLVLPELPSGWVYEGWAVNSGVPLTSGRFTSAEGSDNFDGYSSTEMAPPFPGEDYLVNPPEGIEFPINMGDGASKVVVSVEPDLDGEDPTGPAPFAIKPLVADVPFMAGDHVNYQMSANLGSVPSGTAMIFPTPAVFGTLVDFDSGMIVEGSVVTITSLVTGDTMIVETDSDGHFHFGALDPGEPYLLRIEAPGYYSRARLVYIADGDGLSNLPSMPLFPR